MGKTAYNEALKAKRKGMGTITTEIVPASNFDQVFYYAEDYHQQYLAKPGARPYCSAQPQLVSLPPFEEWATAHLKEKFSVFLPESFWKDHKPKPHGVIR